MLVFDPPRHIPETVAGRRKSNCGAREGGKEGGRSGSQGRNYSLLDSSRSALIAASIGPGSPHSSSSIVIYHLMQQLLHFSTAILPSHDTLHTEGGREGETKGGGGGAEREEGKEKRRGGEKREIEGVIMTV